MSDASRYAISKNGKLVSIFEIDAGDRYAQGPYSCLACGNVMVPALGRVRKHHFKHKAGRPIDCFNETYLHRLGKKTLFEAISDAMTTGQKYPLVRNRGIICDHFASQHNIICTKQQMPSPEDLATRFDRVEIEKGLGGFVADVLLTSQATGENMLLEIAVSHRCEEAKIESGLAIVEIKISTEDDIEQLKGGIDTTLGSVQYHNANTLSPIKQNCAVPCSATGLALLLYRNGKAWYSEVPLRADKHSTSDPHRHSATDPHLVVCEIVDPKIGRGDRKQLTIEASLGDFIIRQVYEVGKNVRSCILCQHNGGRVNNNDIYCIAKGQNIWMSSGAIACDSYFPPSTADDARALLNKL